VAASIRPNTPFTAPHPCHPSACKRRQGITDQSSIRPSSTAAAANPQSSAAFSAQRSSQYHLPPKPLPRQIPIDGQALTASRGFVLRRLSDAGPIPARSLTPGRHPKPFTIPAIRLRQIELVKPTQMRPPMRIAIRPKLTLLGGQPNVQRPLSEAHPLPLPKCWVYPVRCLLQPEAT